MMFQEQPKDTRLIEFIQKRVVPIYGEYRKVFEKQPSLLKAAIAGARASGLSLTGPVGAFIQAFQDSIKNQERDNRIALVKQLAELDSQQVHRLAQLLALHSDEVEQLRTFYSLDQRRQGLILARLAKIQDSLIGLQERIEKGHNDIIREVKRKVQEENEPVIIMVPSDWKGTITVSSTQCQNGMAKQVLEEDSLVQDKESRDKIRNLLKKILKEVGYADHNIRIAPPT